MTAAMNFSLYAAMTKTYGRIHLSTAGPFRVAAHKTWMDTMHILKQTTLQLGLTNDILLIVFYK